MKTFRRLLTMTALVLSLLTSITSIAFAKDYVSIADIREEVREGWHETYVFNGKTIVVDIDIKVPDVDEFPIIEVEKRSSNEAFSYGYGEPYYYLEL